MAIVGCVLIQFFGCHSKTEEDLNLVSQSWIHGSEDCKANKDQLIQVVRVNEDTWIVRQNKCKHYEAPFMFLFFGNKQALLMDTGALAEEKDFPLFKTIRKIIADREKETGVSYRLTVAHTHSHSDHHAADSQFSGKANIVGLEVSDIVDYFHLMNWPDENVIYDLGGRSLIIIPSPGHHKTAISVYDPHTKILLTGDTFYPGRLYVDDWLAFKKTIDRLVEFTKTHEVTYLLGNHIEMSARAGVDYPTGSTFQPEELPLPLTPEDLLTLQTALTTLGDTPALKVLDKFIISPK